MQPRAGPCGPVQAPCARPCCRPVRGPVRAARALKFTAEKPCVKPSNVLELLCVCVGSKRYRLLCWFPQLPCTQCRCGQSNPVLAPCPHPVCARPACPPVRVASGAGSTGRPK